ncbi:MAG: rhomboid family intramembrane serine protease [Deltaproteobacteria bacterium]|nr:rhomboid family intramembrane serine protease [Deltaproteobacteria bacterium]
MRCPFCKTSTFRRVVAGEQEIDRCTACGALWFDYGEIRELTEGRLSPDTEGETPPAPPGIPGGAAKPGAILSRMRREAASLACPRCGNAFTAIDFQLTGFPVFQCPSCEGILAPRTSAAEIAARFRFLREHGARYAALGETLAREEKRRMESEYGPAGPGAAGNMAVPLPMVVPLADNAPPLRSLPIVTYVLIFLAAALYLLGQVRGVRLPLPGGLPGLPPGTGFAGVPKLSLLLAPFLQSGILPLAVGSLFLFVLGDNVEDRMGSAAYFFLYLACGVCAGAAHVLWGKTGGPQAFSSSGAVAGILGAYLVFFPDVSIRLYGMGRILTLPAYLFACAWLVTIFFLVPAGPLANLIDPARLSLPGNLAGFGSGVAGAILCRFYGQPLR